MADGQAPNPFAPASIFSAGGTSDYTSAVGRESASSSFVQTAQPSLASKGTGLTRGLSSSFRGASNRGNSSASRGKAFSNRSAVFNRDDSPSSTELEQVESEHDNLQLWNQSEASQIPSMSSNSAFDNTTKGTGDSPLDGKDDNQGSFNVFQQSTPHASPFPPILQTTSHSENIPPSSNALGGSKESDVLRKKRFEDLPKQNRFFEMKHQRDAQRLEYIRQGILPDPDKAQDLSAAKSLLGTCLEMCPEFEREEREFQNEGDVLEMFPGTNRIDPTIAVKIYRRPAAGRELPLPEDVRPPSVLRETLDYLFHQLLPSDPASTQFTAVQPFMWNRTRAIRQDFIVQGLRGSLEIECHERIARYHILCLHWKGGVGAEGWSEQQELEQLRKTVRSLTEFYEDLRRSTGKSSPNEAEFRAYNLLLHMQDPETLREVEQLPSEVFDSLNVQAALRLRGYAQRSNNVVRRGRPLNTESTMNLWTRYFGEIKNSSDVSYLLACLAENAFSQVRAGAIKAMSKTYLSQHAPLPLDYLRRSLGMDTNEEARSFAAALNCEEVTAPGTDSPVTAMRLAKANEDKPLPSAPFSKTIVEAKRGSHSSQDIVDGKLSGAAPLLPLEDLPRITVSKISGQRKMPLPSTKPAAPSLQPASSPFTVPATVHPSKEVSIASSSATTAAFTSTLSASAPVFNPSSAFSFTKKQAESAFPLPATSSFPAAQIPSSNRPPLVTRPEPPIKAPTVRQDALPSFSSFSTPTPTPNLSASTAPLAMPPVVPEEKRSPLPSITPILQPLTPPTIKPLEPSSRQAVSPSPQPDIAVRASPASPMKPTRTIASVASHLATSLIDEFLFQKLSSVCQQACLRQVRVRRKEIRVQVVSEASNSLMEIVETEAVDDAVARIASEAVADEFRTRSLEKLVIRGRREAVDRAVERKRQADRLEEVRFKLGRKTSAVQGLNGHYSKHETLRAVNKLTAKAMEDQNLQQALLRAKEDRQNLWTPNTFLQAIKRKLKVAAPPDVHKWTVGLSLCQEAEATSHWLRMKLAVEESPLAKDFFRDGDVLEILDLGRINPSEAEERRDVGLVVFEISPSLTREDAGKNGWEVEMQRLQTLSEQSYIKIGHFLPKLLLISWSSSRATEDEEAWRKSILRRLNLGATDTQRYHWSQIELCCLGNQSSSSSPQSSFEKSLTRILGQIQWNKRDQQLGLESASDMCMTSWKTMLEHIQVAFSSHLSSESETMTSKQLAIQSFSTVTVLANRVLDDLVGISDTLLDGQGEEACPHLPVLLWEVESKRDLLARHLTSNEILIELAMRQLEQCHGQTNDDTFLLLQSWLVEQTGTKASTFPWMDYFIRMYQWHLSQLEEVWLECKLPLSHAATSNLAATSKLCQTAWIEVEWRLRDTTPVRLPPTKKKRTMEESTLKKNNDTSKLRRIESPAKRASAASSEVNSLRALMASATHLLNDSSSE